MRRFLHSMVRCGGRYQPSQTPRYRPKNQTSLDFYKPFGSDYSSMFLRINVSGQTIVNVGTVTEITLYRRSGTAGYGKEGRAGQKSVGEQRRPLGPGAGVPRHASLDQERLVLAVAAAVGSSENKSTHKTTIPTTTTTTTTTKTTILGYGHGKNGVRHKRNTHETKTKIQKNVIIIQTNNTNMAKP